MRLKEDCNNKCKEDEKMVENKKIILNKNENSNNNNSQQINNIIIKDDISTPEKLTKFLLQKNNKLLENYEIKEFLDSGSESLVYKVLNKNTKRLFALKLIFNKNNGKRNINEFYILNKLKNINIIKFYGISEILKGQLDGIIMEYGKLGNIKSFMKNILKKRLFIRITFMLF